MQIVWAYLVILEQETGWEVYDRQLGRSLNRGQDLDEVTGWYADLTSRLHKRFPKALRPLSQCFVGVLPGHGKRVRPILAPFDVRHTLGFF
jgi:hypothetical protein